MATEDNKVILNPFSRLTPQQKESVLLNEKTRVYMRLTGNHPNFSLTPEQEDLFKNYSKNPQDIKDTIAARMLSGDNSTGNTTQEQKQSLDNLLRSQSTLNENETNNLYNYLNKISQETGINKNPYDPRHFYDYDRYYKDMIAGKEYAKRTFDQNSQSMHFPSAYKEFGHPTYFNKFIPTLTNKENDLFYSFYNLLNSGR